MISSIPSNALGLIQLSVLLLSCITVFSAELDTVSWVVPPAYHHHAPIYPPVESPKHHKSYPPSHHHYHKAPPPSHPPAKPPTPSDPPTKPPPPSHPPIFLPPTSTRKLVAVQGVVYCKSCIYPGFNSWKASPIVGAVVKLQCKNTRYRQVLKAKTDKNGYFFILAPKTVTTYGSHKCTVSLVSSPSVRCNKPTNINRGIDGAMLIYRERPRVPPLPFALYNVGPFAFESSSKKVKCPP